MVDSTNKPLKKRKQEDKQTLVSVNVEGSENITPVDSVEESKLTTSNFYVYTTEQREKIPACSYVKQPESLQSSFSSKVTDQFESPDSCNINVPHTPSVTVQYKNHGTQTSNKPSIH